MCVPEQSSKLENVLIAFSHHHKNIGYCQVGGRGWIHTQDHLTSHDPASPQGMNMLVAIGILFLDEETVFWMLVAIIEKLLPAHYFTPGLLGAQADQVLSFV